jgi:AAA+ ATPase superfamily predicted ATPase
MNNLFVFLGPIACGKTTLINEFISKNPDFIFLDVYKYIQKYKDQSDHVETDKTLLSYKEIYHEIYKNQDKNIVLELGTNWIDLNLQNIKKLSKKFKVKIFFCILDEKICYQRALKRAKENVTRKINKKDLSDKFKKIFPDNHLKLAVELNLSYYILNMNLPTDKKLHLINKL